jgi:Creatinine amidohydrolase
MRISDMHWQQVEAYLTRDDRAVLPLGSTEQHAYLSLSADSILSERVSAAAAEPLGVPVFPALAYGITPAFRAYPGTLTLRVETYLRVVRDLLDSLAASGFRRIVLVNGHGGNIPAQGLVGEWLADHPGLRVRFHRLNPQGSYGILIPVDELRAERMTLFDSSAPLLSGLITLLSYCLYSALVCGIMDVLTANRWPSYGVTCGSIPLLIVPAVRSSPQRKSEGRESTYQDRHGGW